MPKRSKTILRLSLALSFLAVSAGTCVGPKEPETLDPWCLTEEPIRISRDDVADYIFANDPRLAEWIVIHNERGIAKCGWRF